MTAVPKVDLHVHLEGTISPQMVLRLAERNKIPVPPHLIKNNSFVWESDGTASGALVAFLHSYDAATSVMKCAADYADITHDYLTRSAREGCIYAEITISPDHGLMVGLSYPEMLDAITQGYDRAKKETGIEARLISTCVRHFGPAQALEAARLTRDHPHPLVTGFGMAGDENAYTPADFKPAFDLSGLACRTAHAGEAAGPDSIRAVQKALNVRRFGHMVRAIEDPALMEELKKIDAVPEICVSSNLVLGVFKSYAAHPLRKFFDAGFKVTLGSDDPSFFHTGIGHEYKMAQEKFGFSDKELRQVSRNAIEEAFVDEATRNRLLEKL